MQKRAENIERLLRLLGIWERREDAVGTFSKGTKQKIAIARALIHEPQVLFLDEPTANLDPEAAKTVRDFILDLKKEKTTIFLNTHNLDEAERLCDRIAILKTKLIAVDSPKNLEHSLYNRKTIVHLESVSDAVLAAVKQLGSVKNVKTSDNKLILTSITLKKIILMLFVQSCRQAATSSTLLNCVQRLRMFI